MPGIFEQITIFIPSKKKQSDALEDSFAKIKEKRWTTTSVLQELATQLGQLMSILSKNPSAEEEGRKFEDLADELCDILLQLIYLTSSLNIDISKFSDREEYKKYDSTDLFSLYQLYGQINEAFLEETKQRFSKPRAGFETKMDFVTDRIIKMYLTIFNFGYENGIDLSKKYDEMCQEASHFADAKAATEPKKRRKESSGLKLTKGLISNGVVGLF